MTRDKTRKRNKNFGYLPWDELKPGESMHVPASYSCLVSDMRRMGFNVRSTVVGQPEGKRLIIREKD